MNRKNRSAQYASRASTQFNTYQYFKNKKEEIEEAIVMKITKLGIYVMI